MSVDLKITGYSIVLHTITTDYLLLAWTYDVFLVKVWGLKLPTKTTLVLCRIKKPSEIVLKADILFEHITAFHICI